MINMDEPTLARPEPEFRLLGSLHIQAAGGMVTAGPAKQNAIVAVLLLSANQFVSVDEIAERVWGDEVVTVANIQTYVARIRSLLKTVDTTITQTAEGYRIDVDPLRVDVHRFRRLVAEARARPEHAREYLDRALRLWRGIPFPGTPSVWLRGVRADLSAERHAASLRRNTEWLKVGLHEELLEDLRVEVRKHPYDDRLAADYMLGLYRSGYYADALDFYRNFHRRLGRAQGRQPAEPVRALGERMVRQDPSLDLRAPVPADHPAPRMLPAAPARLHGRDALLATARAYVTAAARKSVAVVAVTGPAGIGKTAYALALGDRLAPSAPGGVLYADLRADPGPGGRSPAAHAVDTFLVALGVLPARVPADLAGKVGLFRTLTAGSRVLVVLDGVTPADDIEPLLPTAPGSVAVVAGRHLPPGLPTRLGAHAVVLGALTGGDAVTLLRDYAGSGDDALLERIAARCAGVPRALCLAGARLSGVPVEQWPSIEADLSDRVAGPGDPVRPVLEWAHAALPAPQSELFALLGAYPGGDIDASAAAALAAVPDAGDLLAGLAAARLVDEVSPGRYAMTGEVRAYAAELLVDTDTRPALARLCDHHLVTARAAVDTMWPDRMERSEVDAVAPTFPDRAAALRWLDAERHNLLAVAPSGGSAGRPRHAIDLARTLLRYLDHGGHIAESAALSMAAVDAAAAVHDGPAQANSLVQLASALIRGADYGAAQQRLDQALAIYTAHADVKGMARALGNLGRVDQHRAHYHEAKAKQMRAYELFLQAGDPLAAARTLTNLGRVCELMVDYPEALRHHTAALDIALEEDAPDAVARARGSIAMLHYLEGRFDEAEELFAQALAGFEKIEDQIGVATTRTNIGKLRQATKRYREAVDLHEQALVAFRSIGDRANEIETLNDLGTALLGCGRPSEALTRHTEALTLAQQAGEHREIADAHIGLADCNLALAGTESEVDAVHAHVAAARAAYLVLGLGDSDRLTAIVVALGRRTRE